MTAPASLFLRRMHIQKFTSIYMSFNMCLESRRSIFKPLSTQQTEVLGEICLCTVFTIANPMVLGQFSCHLIRICDYQMAACIQILIKLNRTQINRITKMYRKEIERRAYKKNNNTEKNVQKKIESERIFYNVIYQRRNA